VNFLECIHAKLAEAPFPVPITYLVFNGCFKHGHPESGYHGWFKEKLTVLEVMNGDAVINPDDPDGDLISTADEIGIYGTDPNYCDTDGDNILDGDECLYDDLDPLDPSDGDPYNDISIDADFDGDGMGNAWELLNSWDWNGAGYHTPLDYSDPSDAYKDYDGDSFVNLWESLLMRSPHMRVMHSDDTLDEDGDGVSSLDEIAAGTWPRDNYDRDFDGLWGFLDPVPYENDTEHIIYYKFEGTHLGTIVDSSTDGSINTGTPKGNAKPGGGLLFLDGEDKTYVDIPATDFGQTSSRTVHMHFWPDATGGHQLLYKEGNTTTGLSIYLDDNTACAK
jgi:hypothetical protein